jgi:hypothetical protein
VLGDRCAAGLVGRVAVRQLAGLFSRYVHDPAGCGRVERVVGWRLAPGGRVELGGQGVGGRARLRSATLSPTASSAGVSVSRPEPSGRSGGKPTPGSSPV